MVKRIIKGMTFLIGFKDFTDVRHGVNGGFKIRMQFQAVPMSVAEFLSEYRGKKPLHIKGAADKFADVMSWDALSGLGSKMSAFIEGSGRFVSSLGLPLWLLPSTT